MEAIVLAGGLGMRLRSAVPDLPKSMAPVGGVPFLAILLARLAAQGVTRVVLSLGYRAEVIQDHFGTSYRGMELVHEVEHQPLGTGGAIRAALARCLADPVLVCNGDTYLEPDLSLLAAQWRRHGQPIVVACAVEDTARYGRIEVQEELVSAFREKGMAGPGLINAGCYVVPRNLLEEYPAGQAFSFETDFLARSIGARKLRVCIATGRFIDIGVPEDYARAQRELSEEAMSDGG